MDALSLGASSQSARFFVLTYLHSHPNDQASHRIKVQMVGRSGETWVTAASAPEEPFLYGYKVDPSAPGAFLLTTEFNLDLRPIEHMLGLFYIQVFVDGEFVAQTPLTLRRRG